MGTENDTPILELNASGSLVTRDINGPGDDNTVATENSSGTVNWNLSDYQGSTRLVINNSLVPRPVQAAILTHDHHHFLAVLALVPFLPAFLAPTPLTLGLTPMTLATTRTRLTELRPRTPTLRQLRLTSRRRTLPIYLDHQHLAVPLRRPLLLHKRPCQPPQAQHQLLDRIHRGRPPHSNRLDGKLIRVASRVTN
jgi:hypothetical protein